MKKFDIYLDFDGTVCEFDYPRIGASNVGSFEVIKKLQDAGHTFILNTARANFNNNTLADAFYLLNVNSSTFFKDGATTLEHISLHTKEKIHPKPWVWDIMNQTHVMYIDDIADGMPLKRGILKPITEVVDWDKLDAEFLEFGLYEKKKLLYLDMDGVCCCFESGVKAIEPDMVWDRGNVDRVCETNPNVFRTLPFIDGFMENIEELKSMFDVYFLSTPMQNVAESYMDKRLWLKEHLGPWTNKRLILTHRKDLVMGDFLVDDRLVNGVDQFTGEHVHFGSEQYPNWEETMKYLRTKI
jgi:5'-nucleotidase